MARHIVGALLVMAVERQVLRHKAAEEVVEVGAHIGRSILLHQQRSRGVAHEQRQQPGLDALLRQLLRPLGGHFVETLAARCDDVQSRRPFLHLRETLAFKN